MLLIMRVRHNGSPSSSYHLNHPDITLAILAKSKAMCQNSIF